MKNDVDKRVVEFEFNNKNFDKNVKKSEKTLKKFEETLQFKDVSKSLDVIKIKFSALEVVMASTVRNITDRVVNLGIRLVKSLSVDNLAAGWQKFGEKTIAVGTLMSQTFKIAGKEIENDSEKMEVINDQLDKLNWFTDETSYNFTDMVDNIGKFTAAGQDLDKSVEAMMGIANWAALSGQNATTASRAMYQLSQALGKGYVQLIDYKSIQNANMDTQEFRKTVLATAVDLGELTKEGENYLTKTGKKFTQNQFAEQLNAKWFTSDVLTASLKKYSSAVDKLYEITEKEGKTASEAIALYGYQFEELGIKAFKAAQEARTFSDAINSVKDAVSTGWMTTAEMIFGSYDEAKEFWTQLANELYDVFAESGNIRNEILSVWKALEGRADLFKRGDTNQGAFWNLYDSIIAVRDVISDAWDTIFPKTAYENEADQVNDLGHNLKTLTENLRQSTERIKDFFEENQNLKDVLEGVFSIAKVFLATLEALRYAIDPLLYTIKELALTVSNMFANLGRQISSSSGYAEFLLEFAAKINQFLTNIFEKINLPAALRKVVSLLKSLLGVVKDIFSAIGEYLGNNKNIKEVMSSMSAGLSSLTKSMKKFFDQVKNGTVNIKESVLSVFVGKGNGLKENKEVVTKTLDILGALKELGIAMLALIKSLYVVFYSIIKFASSFISALASALQAISKYLLQLADWQGDTNKALKRVLLGVAGAFVLFKIIEVVMNVIWMFEYIRGNIFATLDDLADAARKKAMASMLQAIANDLIALAASFMLIILALHMLKDVKPGEIAKGLVIFGVLVGSVILLAKTSKKLKSSFSLLNKDKNVFSGDNEYTTLFEIANVITRLGLAFWLISNSIRYFKDLDDDAFRKFFITLSVILLYFAGMQQMGSKIENGMSSTRRLLPSMWQLIGITIAFKSIMKTLLKTTEALSKYTSGVRWGFVALLAGLTVIFSIIVAINNATKKAITVTAPFKQITANLGLKLGFTLFGVASVLASAALFMLVIKNVGEDATDGLKWVIRIVSAIMALTILLEIAMNNGLKKIEEASEAGTFLKKRNNPISAVLSSVAALLASMSATLFTLSKIKWTDEMKAVAGIVAGFTVVIIIMAAFLQKIKSGEGLTKGTTSALASIVKSIALLLLAMTIAISVLSILPDEAKVEKMMAYAATFILGVLGIVAIISKSSKSLAKVNGSMALLSLNVALFSGALSVLAMGIKYFNDTVKITGSDWAKFGYLAALLGLLLGAGFLTGGANPMLLLAQLGMTLFSLNVMLFSAALIILAKGIKSFQANVKVDWAMYGYLAAVLGLIVAFGALGGIAGPGLLMCSVGMILLAAGLLLLVDPMKQLTSEGVENLLRFLTGLSLIGIVGLLGGLGTIMLGGGLISIGAGLNILVDPMKQLTVEGISNFLTLLSGLSLIGIFGMLGAITSTMYGPGLISLAAGVAALAPALDLLSEDAISKLKSLLSLLSGNIISSFIGFGQGIADKVGLSNGDKIRNGLKNVADGISPLVDQLNRLTVSESGVTILGNLLKLCNNKNWNVTNFKTLVEYIQKIADMNFGDDDFTIKPIIDLTDFNRGCDAIRSQLSSINGTNLSLSARLANDVSAGYQNSASAASVINNTNNSSNDTYEITMNVETNDPYELAEKVDEILQIKYRKRNSTVGISKM